MLYMLAALIAHIYVHVNTRPLIDTFTKPTIQHQKRTRYRMSTRIHESRLVLFHIRGKRHICTKGPVGRRSAAERDGGTGRIGPKLYG